MAVRNYLNNRDLLSEIHKSKATFGPFLDDHAKDYDISLHSVKEVKRATIDQARKNRAERILFGWKAFCEVNICLESMKVYTVNSESVLQLDCISSADMPHADTLLMTDSLSHHNVY